jgi:hypothetical protein
MRPAIAAARSGLKLFHTDKNDANYSPTEPKGFLPVNRAQKHKKHVKNKSTIKMQRRALRSDNP